MSGKLGVAKPSAEAYAQLTRVFPSDACVWYVGDNPAVDIIGATAAGLRTIWLKRFTQWPEDQPECYTEAVSSLQEAFNAILSAA